jgi:dihydroflavonol-4-reductase
MEQYATRVTHKRPYATYKATLFTARPRYYDVGKARRELGLPSTPLADTLTRAVGWFRDNGYVKEKRA